MGGDAVDAVSIIQEDWIERGKFPSISAYFRFYVSRSRGEVMWALCSRSAHDWVAGGVQGQVAEIGSRDP